MSRSSLRWAITLFILRAAADAYPQASSGVPIPGSGEPVCSFVLDANDSGSSIIGCGAYTTLPAAKSWPTTAATVSGGGGAPGSSGGSPPGPPLPTAVTTGGPVSTASDAFATTAPLTTTLSYQGGALTYTKETFSDLTTAKDPTTITTTVTKTSANGALATYTGPIVVGTGGTWWGPPGTAPHCVNPFCLTSGPPGAGTNGPDGGDSGGGEGSDKPAPEACPGGKKVRRSSLYQIFDGRLAKRDEESTFSTNPLKDAFNAFGKDKAGNSLASNALDGAEVITTNKFPTTLQNAYVTGLNGHVTLTQKLIVGTDTNKNILKKGQRIYWQVRWDFDPEKGPHVNAQFGSGPSTKFAYQLDKSQFVTPKKVDPNVVNQAAKLTMRKVTNDMNDKANYDQAINTGKEGEPDWSKAGGKDKAISTLKDAWKAVANGPCT